MFIIRHHIVNGKIPISWCFLTGMSVFPFLYSLLFFSGQFRTTVFQVVAYFCIIQMMQKYNKLFSNTVFPRYQGNCAAVINRIGVCSPFGGWRFAYSQFFSFFLINWHKKFLHCLEWRNHPAAKWHNKSDCTPEGISLHSVCSRQAQIDSLVILLSHTACWATGVSMYESAV